jgi:UDP-GlcNAc:undecaprenyl-phosphate GlcNAc-1-phosphate transferase
MKYMPWVAFVLSLALTLFLTPAVRALAFKYGAVAIPRERDVHKKPLPRWGGLAMVGGFLSTMAIAFAWGIARHTLLKHGVSPWNSEQILKMAGVTLAILLITVVGAIDDKIEVSAKVQSLALAGAGLILYFCHIRIEGITNVFHAAPIPKGHHYNPENWVSFAPWFSAFATILWTFGVAKTVDFIDGLDGLAAGVCAICATTLAIMSGLASAQTGQYEVTIMAAALVGCCFGFLRYNWNPASIIMGTVGAQFLGFMLATISIIGTMKIAATLAVLFPLLVLFVPVGDGIRVVVGRLIKRTPAYLPDKTSHIHHILINKGLSTKNAVWVIYGLTICCCCLALFLYIHF